MFPPAITNLCDLNKKYNVEINFDAECSTLEIQ